MSLLLDVNDTIAALATPPGRGGIGIVRVSGPESTRVAALLVRPTNGSKLIPRRLSHGWIIDPESGQPVDEVLAVYMPAPKTYTGQDILEIQAHGGPIVLRRLLDMCLAAGCRLAEPGEFTWRAYYHGRIDLAQAEAVADLIETRTEAGAALAAGHLAGNMSRPIERLTEILIDFLAEVEAEIDFPEEDIDLDPLVALAERLTSQLLDPINQLIDSATAAKALREGVRVTLAGRPNAGKSSLLNQLLARDRALVTDVPGTTRDYLEESFSLDGIPIVLTDTAGLRALPARESDRPEAAGIAVARKIMASAQVIVVVVDATDPHGTAVGDELSPANLDRTVVAVNKADLADDQAVRAALDNFQDRPRTAISALTGQGIPELKRLIKQVIETENRWPEEWGSLPTMRQAEALTKAVQALERAVAEMKQSQPPELAAMELREGLDQLGRITGRTAPDAVLNQIFSRFCLGK